MIGEPSEQVCAEKRKTDLKTNYVQFDELFTYEKSKCLPVAVALAVRPKTGEIVSARAGRIPCDTNLKQISLRKFSRRADETDKTLRQKLKDFSECVKDKDGFTIANDSDTDYRTLVQQELPFAKIDRYVGDDLKKRSKALDRAKAMATVDSDVEVIDYSNTDNYGKLFVKKMKNGKHVVRTYDPLFSVNQKCMKLRASISRMRRDYWGYTRKMENLQLHLWLFTAANNGYELPTKRKVGSEPPKEVEKPKVTRTKNFDLSRIDPEKASKCTITHR